MNSDANPVATLALTFAMMSLFAVGGANSAIPEMHRVAVDVNHWLTDKQFADVFAISHFSPGSNVLIVTLIGYSVAGRGGALVATLPISAGPSYVFLALDHDAAFIAEGALASCRSTSRQSSWR